MTTQGEQFEREGYAIFENALDGEMLELLRDQCAAFVAHEDRRMDQAGVDRIGLSHRGKRYFANECQRRQPALRRMLFSPVMARICAATLGPTAYFFLDQFVVKGPDRGMPFSWHQDSGYVAGNGGPPDHAPYLTCWCPLDDATIANGTVRVVPFSAFAEAKAEILPHVRDAATGDLAIDAPESLSIALEAPAGSIVVFSSRLPHATGPNLTDRPRRVYLAQYTPEAMLDPGTRRLRRNAIALVERGEQVTFA